MCRQADSRISEGITKGKRSLMIRINNKKCKAIDEHRGSPEWMFSALDMGGQLWNCQTHMYTSTSFLETDTVLKHQVGGAEPYTNQGHVLTQAKITVWSS